MRSENFGQFFQSCSRSDVPDFLPDQDADQNQIIPEEIARVSEQSTIVEEDKEEDQQLREFRDFMQASERRLDQLEEEEKKIREEEQRQEVMELNKSSDLFVKMSREDIISVLQKKLSQYQSQYCDLDLKLLKFWDPSKMNEGMISMLVSKECSYFLVGLNLVAHFLDEPSVQKLYESQDDPKIHANNLLNGLIADSSSKSEEENLKFLQDLLNLLDKTASDREDMTKHLQTPPSFIFHTNAQNRELCVFDAENPDVISLRYDKLFGFQKYEEKQDVLTSAFCVCFSILVAISRWKSKRFVVSPLKFMRSGKGDPDIGLDGSHFFELMLFGGGLHMRRNQISFFTNGENITDENKYIHFTSYQSFFTKDFWETTSKGPKAFRLKGFDDPDSKYSQPVKNVDLMGPGGRRRIYCV
jgi:hypothetical protein